MQELAIHGTRVTFCFSSRVDDAHQTSSKFLKYHPFSCCLWFSLLVCLLCLGKKAITRGFSYFLSYKCKWQSEMIFEKERERWWWCSVTLKTDDILSFGNLCWYFHGSPGHWASQSFQWAQAHPKQLWKVKPGLWLNIFSKCSENICLLT